MSASLGRAVICDHLCSLQGVFKECFRNHWPLSKLLFVSDNENLDYITHSLINHQKIQMPSGCIYRNSLEAYCVFYGA